MDWSGIGAIASLIAALGVLWERWTWWRSRPRSDVQVRVTNRREFPFFKFEGDGEWAAQLKNWGSEPAFSVETMGFHCAVSWGSEREKLSRVDPGVVLPFSVDFDPEDADRAWILVTWTSPSGRRDATEAAWFPISELEELAAIRERQIDRSWFRTAVARRAIGRLPSPASVARGRIRTMSPSSPARTQQRDLLRPPTWWRRWSARLVRVEPEIDVADMWGL